MRADNSISIDPASSDETLMSAFAGGDRSAFDTLYTRHQVPVLRFVRRMMGQALAGEGEEVFRQIWLRIVDERDEFGSASTGWRSWAFRIARGVALERLRLTARDADYHAHDDDEDGAAAARMFGRALLAEGADPEPGGVRSEEEEEFWRAAGRRLLTCLEELPDDERAAFLLRQQEDFDIAALAYALGVEEDGARKRLRRALDKLRGCMERYLSVLGAMPAQGESEAAEVDDERLRDPYLGEALLSAPDVGAVPDWRVGNAVLDQVHDALLGSAEPDFEELDGAPRSGRGLRYGGIALVLAAAAGAWYWMQQPTRHVRVESVAGGAPESAAVEPPPPAASAPAAPPSAVAAATARPSTVTAPVTVAKADDRPAARESKSLIPELQALFGFNQTADDTGGAGAGVSAAPANAAPANSRAAAAATTAPAAPAAPAAAAAAAAAASRMAAAAAAASNSAAMRAAPPAAATAVSNTPVASAPTPAPAQARSATTGSSAAPTGPTALTGPTAPTAPGAPTAPTARAAAPAATTAAAAAAAPLIPTPPAPPARSTVTAALAPLPAPPLAAAPSPAPAPKPTPTPSATPSPEALKPLSPAPPSAKQTASSQPVARVQPDLQPASAKTPPPAPSATQLTPPVPPTTPQTLAMNDRARPATASAPAVPAAGSAATPAPIPPAVAAAPVPGAPPANAANSSSTVRTDDTPPPTFDALSQWSRITITRRDGTTRTLTRAEAGDLNGLLGSAAIAAVGSKPLGGSPEWKATLERPNGDVIAVLEVASTTVRWREGRTPPATGIPSGLALAGLREAMSDAVRPPRPAQPVTTEAAASRAETAEPAPESAGDKP